MNLPPHLREDASFIQCNLCGRKSYGGEQVNTECSMKKPSGERCKGLLEGKFSGTSAEEAIKLFGE